MKTVYWPVACDLQISDDGKQIVVGPETKTACMGVVEHIEKHKDEESFRNYVIVPCASVPKDKKWNGITMSKVMHECLLSLGVPYQRVFAIKAKTFNTQGEAEAIVDYISKNKEIKRLVISVKWWHSLRAYNWILLYLKKKEIYDVEIEVYACGSQVSPSVISREFWLAYPFNIIRMLRFKFF